MPINLSQIYSHIGEFHGKISRFGGNMCWSTLETDSLVFMLFFKFGEISFSAPRCCSLLSTAALGAGARWIFWSEDVDQEVVDLSLFHDFIDRMRWILVKRARGCPWLMCYNDICLATCSGHIHWLAKPLWRWCFNGSGDGGDSTSLPTCA
jgi:hypothetical protein